MFLSTLHFQLAGRGGGVELVILNLDITQLSSLEFQLAASKLTAIS